MKVELKVVGGSRSGQTIPITIPQFMIGRAEDCHLKPRSELISRYHCTILSEDAYVAVRDLGSKNGVYVNGERIVGERELKNGDHIVIGPLEFEIALSVALKGATKPKVDSISDVVARTVEQNAINVATAKQAQAASQPTPAPAPAQPAPAQPVQEAAKAPAPAPAPAPAADAGPSPFTVAPINAAAAVSDSDDPSSELADWLLDDDDDESSNAQTVSMTAFEDLDLPYTPKEEEKEETAKEPQKASGPSSSDAAAQLLKNFFKGGR
ncbi:MAG: FHA domain-containing protein [Thermoguttaceae bacterium]|nr:FHA domain-containing protein [Thermoguttaceae bacterium]MBQ2039354.1 FHA domain-containing protein [Thermoguttaceae bacterium]MBQ2554922.1 FHA domain-containing protein [Thermoguttaceae bacterium]MBQ3821617.1 FHA domain-containing protein [Thermoguttaceae bacterium]MBQ4202959.1 FHA domain-containing protein [Thermoguttaceae bacterium]